MATTYSKTAERVGGVGGDVVETHTWAWTAAADGSVTAKASDAAVYGSIEHCETEPGGTAPTALYDVTITDANGIDVMGGELENRSATLAEVALPLVGSGYSQRYVNSVLTLNVSNNSVNGGQGVCRLKVRR